MLKKRKNLIQYETAVLVQENLVRIYHMRPNLDKFNIIIDIARYIYSKMDFAYQKFVTLGHFMLFSKIKNIYF